MFFHRSKCLNVSSLTIDSNLNLDLRQLSILNWTEHMPRKRWVYGSMPHQTTIYCTSHIHICWRIIFKNPSGEYDKNTKKSGPCVSTACSLSNSDNMHWIFYFISLLLGYLDIVFFPFPNLGNGNYKIQFWSTSS